MRVPCRLRFQDPPVHPFVGNSHQLTFATVPAIGKSISQHTRGIARRPVQLACEVHNTRTNGIVIRRGKRGVVHAWANVCLRGLYLTDERGS